LPAGDTQLTSGRTQTALCAGKRCLAHFDGQLSYLDANPLGHRPASMCYRVDVIRHSALPHAFVWLMGLGRIGRLMGSQE
jgi:hypothetical protein